MSEPICTDCKWVRKGVIENMCAHPKCNSVKRSRLAGGLELGYCSLERTYDCGPSGSRFEPKEETQPDVPEFLNPTFKITWRIRLLAWLRRVHAKL